MFHLHLHGYCVAIGATDFAKGQQKIIPTILAGWAGLGNLSYFVPNVIIIFLFGIFLLWNMEVSEGGEAEGGTHTSFLSLSFSLSMIFFSLFFIMSFLLHSIVDFFWFDLIEDVSCYFVLFCLFTYF
ncbi:hypothetical protein DM02DRAFT_240599 [Periconia macrospinosa]|uniref:Uncharacterized protein n=1 Tax=Periconia macrospinosa TaxID=97972 RepID=A0A2V1DZN8_9PLEO|nr:hypothetical protein DM02DRAFT_240599 [Periconia macrospinosa]